MPTNPPPFVTGDVVKLKSGHSTIHVLEVDYFICDDKYSSPISYAKSKYCRKPKEGWYIRFRYGSDHNLSHHRKWREAEDFELLHKQKEEPIMTNSLYQTKEEKPRFGTFLVRNSKKEIVLEMKGKDGNVEAFAEDDVEEVMPYTVEVTAFKGGVEDGPKRHYAFAENSVEIGDVLVQLTNGLMWEVTALDTKKKHPTATKNGFFKLEGKRLD